MRILLIEDDERLTRLIARVLKEEHFAVDVAHDGDTGLELAPRQSDRRPGRARSSQASAYQPTGVL